MLSLAILSGCAKETQVAQVAEVTIGGAKHITSRTFVDRPILGPDCVSPAQNCIWPIEIVGKKKTMVNQVTDLLLHGTTEQVRAYFESNSTELVTVFAEQHVSGVINGTYTVRYLGANAAGTLHFGFYRAGNAEVELVYPLIPS